MASKRANCPPHMATTIPVPRSRAPPPAPPLPGACRSNTRPSAGPGAKRRTAAPCKARWW
eukprot:10734673-Lingulodinium_polyedra.AAC.1